MPPDICRLYGTIFDVNGNAAVGIGISVKLKSLPPFSGVDGITTTELSTITNESGEFEINLAQGTTVELEILRMGIRQDIDIPALTEAEYSTLI